MMRVKMIYTNYRGETSVREIWPQSIRFGSTEWHPKDQWLLLAWDYGKEADREFALGDCNFSVFDGVDLRPALPVVQPCVPESTTETSE